MQNCIAKADLVEMPKATKELPCSGCSKTITVNPRVVMGYCAACSAKMGVKR